MAACDCREDVATAARLQSESTEQACVFRNLASAAESGWDFSSRWMAPGGALSSTRITCMLPVDLNTFLWKLEHVMAVLLRLLGDAYSESEVTKARRHSCARSAAQLPVCVIVHGRFDAWTSSCTACVIAWHVCASRSPHSSLMLQAVQWEDRARRRATSMHDLMWNEQTGRWHDLHVPALDSVDTDTASGDTSVSRAEQVGTQDGANAVSWLPFLWGMPGAGCEHEASHAEEGQRSASAIVRCMQQSGLLGANGLLNTTTKHSGEQWDAPNCWPPLLCMWMDGLLEHGGPSGAKLANTLAQAYLRAVRRSLEAHGVVYEKYATEGEGETGGGGEYAPQIGFGWSNGVALHLMCTLKMQCE